MFKENSTTDSKPHYYIYPGLRSVTLPLARGHYSPEERLDFIMKIVREEFSKKYEIDIDRMMDGTREMPYALARMAFYYFARMQCPTLTLREISRFFVNLRQHHTTIMHACTAVQNIIDTKDTQYYDIIMAIDERLK